MPIAEQLDFASIAFPKDRKVLVVAEVADKWGISDQHVIDLCEEGKLDAFDIAGGRFEYTRIPTAALDALAKQLNVPIEVIRKIIDSTKPQRKTSRANWRIPVEGYNQFLRENRS